MKMISFRLMLFLGTIIGLSDSAFGQQINWVKQAGGAGWDEGSAIKTDQDKNVYVAGFFEGTVDFDPGPAVFNLTSVYNRNAFVCKLDSSGNFVWALQYGDSASLYEKSAMGLDESGNIYITNSFLGTVDFDPGPGTFYMTSVGWDINNFILKLDGNGNFLWAKQIGAVPSSSPSSPVHSYAIAVDDSGNQYLTGYFDGSIDFDPGTGNFLMTSNQFNDIFICKLDALGDFVWAKQFSSYGGSGYDIAVDDSGNVYTTGTIGGTTDFDPGPGVYNLTTSVALQSEIFTCKLNAAGDFVWANAMGPGEGLALAIDDRGHTYSCGWAPLGYTPLLYKTDAQGNLSWGKDIGGSYVESIVIDPSGNIYSTGACYGTNDFDPGPGVFNLTGANSDTYISKLDSAGNFIWAGLFTSADQVYPKAITVDHSGDVYTTGFFGSTTDFDPSSSVFNLTSVPFSYDIYIHKLTGNMTTGLQQNDFANEFKIFPNPTTGSFMVGVQNFSLLPHEPLQNLIFSLRDLSGREIQTNPIINTTLAEFQFNAAAGIYFLEITDPSNRKAVVKVVKE
ncbi:MAG: SBBP repeat-containing protein [Bacteroidia bacterium]